MLKQNLLITALGIFIAISILLSNFVYLTFNQNFYESIFSKENIYQNFQSKVKARSATKELMNYFRGNNILEQDFYSKQAITHLADVKNLLNITKLTFLLTFVISALSVIILFLKNKFLMLKKIITLAIIIIIAILLIAFIGYLINFGEMFIYFHKIFFRNNLWLFPQNDNLIKLFPISFFIEFTKQLLINIFATVFILLCLVYFLPKDDSKTN